MAKTESLVEYRLLGGPVGVDQRLAVFADGRVELDERHRRRDSTRMTIDEREIERLRTALAEIPDALWSRGPTLARSRAKTSLRRLFTLWPKPELGTAYFQLRLGGRSIAGEAEDLTEADAARALLEDLRVRALQLAEALQPTGSQ